MQTRINSTFIQRGYNGLVDSMTERELADIIRSGFPEGSEVQVDMTISLVRMRQLCEAWVSSYHTRCQHPLTDEGVCPNYQHHWVEETVEAS
jgi:hypothetical protein